MKKIRHILEKCGRWSSVLPRGNSGFTLIEMAFVCEVMMLLTLISFNEMRTVREHARVTGCMQFESAIQRSMWGDYAFDGFFPNSAVDVLNRLPSGVIEKTYTYKPLATGLEVGGVADQYYLRCDHDHSYVGVLFCDSGAYLPPKPIYALAAARGAIP